MKKQRIILSLVIALAVCLQMAVVSFAASTTLYFSEHDVDLGDSVTVTVTFRGSDISGVQFNIDYDSSVLTYKSSSGTGSTSYNGGKTVSNLDSGSTDSYSVNFVFTANAKGSSQITVNGVKVSDSNGDAINGFEGASAKLNVVSASGTEKPEESTTEKQTEEKTTEKATESTTDRPLKSGEIALGGRIFTLVDDSAFVDAPDGFDETYSDFNGNKILTYTSKDKSQQIVCIMDEDNQKSFALFDDVSDTFSEYLELKSAALPIVLIPAKDSVIPDGFKPVNIEVGGLEIVAYDNEQFKANGICLIYGLSTEEGKANLYVYDTSNGTLQKYYNINTPAPKQEETTQPVTEAVTQADIESSIPLSKAAMIKIICAVSVVLLASLIAIVTLAVKLRKKDSPDGYDDNGDDEIYVADDEEDEDQGDIYFTRQ